MLTVPSPNAAVKNGAVVAGMVAGAESFDNLARLRHGGMGRLFTGIRMPSTLGAYLGSFTFGHVRQLDEVAAEVLTNLAGHTPQPRDADRVCFGNVDDTVNQIYGHAKQGAGYGEPLAHAKRRHDFLELRAGDPDDVEAAAALMEQVGVLLDPQLVEVDPRGGVSARVEIEARTHCDAGRCGRSDDQVRTGGAQIQ